MLAPRNIFAGVAAELMTLVGEPPIEANKNDGMQGAGGGRVNLIGRLTRLRLQAGIRG